MKVGIIRCQQKEDMCQGAIDFKAAKEGLLAFEATGPVEVIGFVSCGGCPGKRAGMRAKMMAARGAEAIVLASCIGRGVPAGATCPHFQTMKEDIEKKLGAEVKVIDWTH
jgi:predicted metal-binding protein